jgi:hypothetical protein
MVGRRVLLRVEKGEAKPADGQAFGEEPDGATTRRGVTWWTMSHFDTRRRDRRHRRSRRQRPVGTARRSRGHPPAKSRRNPAQWRPSTSTGRCDPAELRRRGLAHVPEDRHHVGLVTAFEESENAILGYHDDPKYGQRPFLSPTWTSSSDARREDRRLRHPSTDPRLKTANFSGGNQQKIVLAREMERAPDVLLVGQPTRGVDVGAIEFIHKRLIEMRDQGKAVLLVSVELDEMIARSPTGSW